MMRELKILAVVVFFTLVTYWGVEPYAHSLMHKDVDHHNFEYRDLEPLNAVGDAEAGKAAVQMHCTACHGIEADGIAAPMDPAAAGIAYGVNPPDLSTAGLIYDERFLAAVIKDPVGAMKIEDTFDETNPHPMPAYGWMSDQEIADMVAYFKDIAPTSITAQEAFEDSCMRCHDMRYMDLTVFGKTPEFDSKQDELEFRIQEADYKDALRAYMGITPPDVSTMYASRGESFMRTFIENPQSQLSGTSMPRVGITEETADLVLEYMEDSADPKKDEREALAPWVFGFLILFTVLAYFWKKSMWKDLH